METNPASQETIGEQLATIAAILATPAPEMEIPLRSTLSMQTVPMPTSPGFVRLRRSADDPIAVALKARAATRKWMHGKLQAYCDFLALASDPAVAAWFDKLDPDGDIGRELFEAEFEKMFGRVFIYPTKP